MADGSGGTAAAPALRRLLAVDLGLRTGFALFDDGGRLERVGSRNFGTRTRLRGGADGLLREAGSIQALVVEGDRALGDVWAKRAGRRGAQVLRVAPETWRARLLHPREQRSGAGAKQAADALARRVITTCGDARPASLRHDAAEAVLIGLWALLELGWLPALPAELDPRRR
ncbi:hypothetical protein [Egicoccus sp. AB-alg2]|uniref:hypothetical protein n=1 Tax=Egicoccus sp. AB-alg2 TaxID=3242693 RepID=UPI00359D1EC5